MEIKNINFMNDIELKSMKKIKPHVNPFMIQPPFIAGFVGTRGSGKTCAAIKLIVELIHEGALKSQDVYIVSSTFHQNEVFCNIPNLKKKNILTNLNDINAFIERLEKELEFILKVWKTTRKKYTREEYSRWYDSVIQRMNKYDDDEECDDMTKNFNNIEYLHLKLNNCEPIQYFYDYVPHFLIFVDDAFNTRVYADSVNNAFKNFCIKHRHYNCSLIMAVQSFAGGINAQLRVNVSCWCIWRQPKKEFSRIYDEVMSEVIDDEDHFVKMFKKITYGNMHNFLMVDKEASDPRLKFRRGFNQIILFNSNNYINGEIDAQLLRDKQNKDKEKTKENDETTQTKQLVCKKPDNSRIEEKKKI